MLDVIIIGAIVLCGVAIVRVIGNIMRISAELSEQKEECKLHKWQYVMISPDSSDVSRMVCAKCNFVAGSGE